MSAALQRGLRVPRDEHKPDPEREHEHAAELPDVMPDADSRSGADCNRAASPPPPAADLIEF